MLCIQCTVFGLAARVHVIEQAWSCNFETGLGGTMYFGVLYMRWCTYTVQLCVCVCALHVYINCLIHVIVKLYYMC